ncbi:MAG: hypothetical protein JHD07_02435 [Bradyrhizobium sp.]|uniref:hypothetical protein n=1 Tax=Bradyrhizobium sp. TaxID=376 RepID=UPI001A2D7DA7|nr:hypothetical protein [Bradyrhizobium sp.]MBJ7402204.1 hypothetical protein [Bradyrhizobium sp.]
MTDQISPNPPPLPAEKPKTRRGLKVLIGFCAAAFLIANLLKLGSGPKLEVERTGFFHQGNIIKVLNVGDKEVTVTAVTVNDRPDCRPNEQESVTLKVGESMIFPSACRIVRADIQTDQGRASFTFSGPPD